MYDVIIIGSGVIGSAVARELSRYQLKTCVLEKGEDVGAGTSKANSGIVHAGFDAVPGSNKAIFNVEGNQMMEELSKEIDFPFRRNGSLVLCFREEDYKKLEELVEQGEKNGIKGLRILTKEELKEMEPNISDNAVAALYAPTGGIVCPFKLTVALAENANVNGVEFKFNTEVKNIEKCDGFYKLSTDQEVFESKVVINAAGVYADVIHNMISDKKIEIIPRKGEYCLLDKAVEGYVDKTIFQLPTAYGKGVLITPTVHGNILVGPTAKDIENKEGVHTTREGIDELLTKASLSVKNLPTRQIITSFAGLRAHSRTGDFIIGEVEDAKGFIDIAGIESPGLTCAPAIGKKIAKQVKEILKPKVKDNFIAKRKDVVLMSELSNEEKEKLIKQKPEYANIVCRCEMVSEGEIIDAIHRPLGAKSLDGIKRRTRVGMGRCQTGFCAPKTMEILTRELNKSPFSVTKSGGDSTLLIGSNKELL